MRACCCADAFGCARLSVPAAGILDLATNKLLQWEKIATIAQLQTLAMETGCSQDIQLKTDTDLIKDKYRSDSQKVIDARREIV